MMMPSLHSSVGSESSSSKRNLLISDSENTKPLRSSWIRRLLSTPPHQPPNVETPPPPQLAVHSSSTTASGGGSAVLGHRTTISTDESRTQPSTSDFRSASFVRRLLNFRPEPPLPQEDRPGGSCFAPGIGPFQVRTRRSLLHADGASAESSLDLRNSLIDSNCLKHKFLQFQEVRETPGQLQLHLDRNLGEHGGIGNCRYRNSHGEALFPSKLRKTHINEEEERRESGFCRIGDYGGGARQHNWLHHNGEKMVVDERTSMADDGSRSLRADSMVSRLFPERRVIEEQHGFQLSPFFCYRPSLMQDTLKKHENPGESRTNSLMGSMRDDYLRGPMGREINQFMDSDLTSSRVPNRPWAVGDKTRCSSFPRLPPVAQDLLYHTPEQGLYGQCLSVEPWQTTTTVHGVKCVSRSRGPLSHAAEHGTTPT